MTMRSTVSLFALACVAGTILLWRTMSPLPVRAYDKTIQPDCQNNPHPVQCTEMINDLVGELNYFNAVFAHPDAVQAALFYHPQAILYTTATGLFYAGRESIQNNYFVPFVAVFASGQVDFSAFHYSVIDENTIVAYGALAATGVFKNGGTFTQPPLPQNVVFVRNPDHDPNRPFVIISDHE